MSRITLILFLLSSSQLAGQTTGFEFLSSSKSSLESIVKIYAATIPDTSETFRKYYLSLATQYSNAKASYDGYRGAMKDCVLGSDTRKTIQKCLKSKVSSIKTPLDSLNYYLTQAYLEAAAKKIVKNHPPFYTGTNTGVISGEVIKGLLEGLVAGTIKVWDQVQKYRKD